MMMPIVTIAFGVLSPLTFLAYKHYDAFRRINKALYILMGLFLLMVCAFDAGILVAEGSLSTVSADTEIKERLLAAIHQRLFPLEYAVGGTTLLSIYLTFLNFFPELGIQGSAEK